MAATVDYNVLKESLGPDQVLEAGTDAYTKAGKIPW